MKKAAGEPHQMKIAYFGSFLREGLCKKGHHVYMLPLRRGADLETVVADFCPDADIVLLEICGGNFPFVDITRCAYKIALYCIDSTINEFWLEHMAALADYVFVDQQRSVASLARVGVHAHRLLLCVSEKDFRDERPLKYDVGFVGTVDAYRIKRTNVLRLIEKNFPLYMRNNISSARMSDIFAASKISINENLFKGLTLRILQCMAAGTVLFTEADNPDVKNLFEDKKELVYYGPDTLIPRLTDVLDNYPAYRHIAYAGREVCWEHHRSEVRAGEFLQRIERHDAHNPRRGAVERRFHCACADFLYGVRFGGYIGNARKAFYELIEAGETQIFTGKAALMLGDMLARLNHAHDACTMYRLSEENGGGVEPLIKTAIVQCGEKALASAACTLRRAGAALRRPVEKLPYDEASLLLSAARMFFAMGKISTLGFIEPDSDAVPDSALSLAFKSWQCRNSEEALDVMIACAGRADVEIELLPTLVAAVRKLRAEKRHILHAAELAYKCYDKELAETVLAALRKTTGGHRCRSVR